MPNPTPHKDLARWLIKLLSRGIPVDETVLAYAEASFGTADLAMLLTETDNTEADSLLELVFYPDFDAQMLFEDRWGAYRFSHADRLAVETALCAASLLVPLILLPENRRLMIQPPDFALAAFVQRLNITWQLPATLARVLRSAWPDNQSLQARVHMRNAHMRWNSSRVSLLERFVTQIPAEAQDSVRLLSFLLSILPELETGTDAFEFLTAKKFFYFQSLCKAEAFERTRQTSNMEIMMLQGHRSAFGDMDQWRRYMRHIDSLCRHLYGRIQFFERPSSETIDVRGADNRQQLADVVRKLS